MENLIKERYNVITSNSNNVKRLTLIEIEKEAQSIALALDDTESLKFYCMAINKLGIKEVRAMVALAKDKGKVPKKYFTGIYKNKAKSWQS